MALSSSYRFMSEAIEVSGFLRALQLAVGGMCLSMTVLGCVTLWHPLGPDTDLGRNAQLVFAISATPIGFRWAYGRWPSFRGAVLFVVWANLGIAVAAVSAATPEARITTVINMALVGVFVSFLMGPVVMAAHCAFAACLVVGLATQAVLGEGWSWFDTYMFVTPALIAVVVMPIVIQVVIEGGRRAVARTARQALRDPMTGLANRRGLREHVKRAMAGRAGVVLVAAAIDLDRFKQLNDDHGHQRGDEALRAVAQALRATIRTGDIAARLGGDEFVVVAPMTDGDSTVAFAERIRAAVEAVADIITASVGTAAVEGEAGDRSLLDEAIRRADRAMYEAKRQGGARLVVWDETSVPDAT